MADIDQGNHRYRERSARSYWRHRRSWFVKKIILFKKRSNKLRFFESSYFFSPSLLRSLLPSLPRSLALSLPRSFAPSFPRSLAPSFSRSLAPSLPPFGRGRGGCYIPLALKITSLALLISWNFFSAARFTSSPSVATRSG